MPKASPQKLGARILRAVRSRGSDARDVRDAAHEASHALELGLTDWSRLAIMKAVDQLDMVAQFRSEVLARAVEAEICRLCQFDYNQDYYLMIASVESAKNGLILPGNFKELVEQARKGLDVFMLVQQLRKIRARKAK